MLGGEGGGLKDQKPKRASKKGKYRHKITNVPVHKMGLGVMNSTLANHLMGPVQGFKMVPCTNS